MPTPPIAAQMPIARLRSAPSSKLDMIRDNVAGDSSAPPSPCNPLAIISISCELDKPPNKEPMPKRAIATTNIFRLPNKSDNRPPISRKPPKMSEYALTTHCKSLAEKPKASPSDGKATKIIV
ncbi:hypothetical protein D3C87_1768490 [compost metagenome]